MTALSASAQTAAETAALEERPLGAEENEVRNRDCGLPVPNGQMTFDGRDYPIVELPSLELLALAVFDETFENDPSGEGVRAFEFLPYGGLWFRDNCDPVVMSVEGGSSAMTLWVRPGLDLTAEYPTAYAQIRHTEQMISVASHRYMVIPFGAESEAEAVMNLRAIVEALAGWPEFELWRPSLWTRGAFFIPLSEGVGE